MGRKNIDKVDGVPVEKYLSESCLESQSFLSFVKKFINAGTCITEDQRFATSVLFLSAEQDLKKSDDAECSKKASSIAIVINGFRLACTDCLNEWCDDRSVDTYSKERDAQRRKEVVEEMKREIE